MADSEGRAGAVEVAGPATVEATTPLPAPVGAELGLLVMVVIWAVNFSVIKYALAELPPMTFNALRFPLAALVVYGILRWRGAVRLPPRADVKRIVVLAVLGNVVYQLFFIFGMARTRAGNASLLLAGTPILTALISAALGHERVGGAVWLGVAATFAGMALVVAGGAGDVRLAGETLTGDLILLGASVCWSIYTVGARDPIARHGSVPVTAWTLWAGALGLFLLGLPGLARLDWAAVSWGAWAAVAYAGLLGVGLAYVLWYQGVHHVGNTKTATYSNLVPVLALLVAWATLGEVPTAWQVAGAAVIIGGVTLARWGRAARPARS